LDLCLQASAIVIGQGHCFDAALWEA
jgi:hypothetical protein